MNINEYQNSAMSFASYGGDRLDYALLGLAGEMGEVAGKAAKFVRRNNLPVDHIMTDSDTRQAIALELGDVLWMVAAISARLGYDLGYIARLNITKLEGRRERGTIIGDGDYR